MNNNLTITSLEIAKITGKGHSEFIRDIRLLNKEEFSNPLETYSQSTPNDQSFFGYEFPFMEMLSVISNYDFQKRHDVITRWLELEEESKPPVFSNDPIKYYREYADWFEKCAAKIEMFNVNK